MKTALMFTVAVLCLVGNARADDQAAAYAKAVRSVVGVICTAANGDVHRGTGVVVLTTDVVSAEGVTKLSLVATAEHVISEGGPVEVILPIRDDRGAVVGTPDTYKGREKRCLVKSRSHDRDLALLLVAHTESVEAIGIALRANAGEQVFTIGAGSDVLWHYAGGHVRQVYNGAFKTHDTNVKARLLDMTIPVNPGDSGGPVISQSGKLVGINLSTDRASNQVNTAVEVSEIFKFMKETMSERQTPPDQQEKPKVRRMD